MVRFKLVVVVLNPKVCFLYLNAIFKLFKSFSVNSTSSILKDVIRLVTKKQFMSLVNMTGNLMPCVVYV